MTAEVAAFDAQVSEHERAAAEANAMRQSALTAHGAHKADLGARLKSARDRVTKTEQAIVNNRRVLEDREDLEAAKSRAAELDTTIPACTAEAARNRADAQRWNDAAKQHDKDAAAAKHRCRIAGARADNARSRMRDRDAVLSAVSALPALRDTLNNAAQTVDAMTGRLEAARAAGLVSAEGRILQLRGTLAAIVAMECDPIHTAREGLDNDDAAVEAAKEAPARVAKALADSGTATDALRLARNAASEAERLAALAPTIEAAQADLDAATADALAAGTEESEATRSAATDRETEHSLLGYANGIEAQISAMTAERAGLNVKLLYADRLATAEARIQELEAHMADETIAVSDLEIEIEALPIEPPEAVQAGEHADCALERAAATKAGKIAATKAMMDVGDQLSAASVDRTRIRSTLDVAEVQSRTAQNAVALAQNRVETARKSSEALAAMGAERATIEAALADWTLLAESLGPKGIQALLIDAAGPELTALVNDLLVNAFGPRWTVSIETTRQSADGKKEVETCDVKVIDTERGREATAESLSGGEGVIVGEAISLALSMLAIRRSGMQGVTLFRDESGAALSTENGRAWVQMLRRAADIVGASHVVYVSHASEVQDMADAKILIEDGSIRIA